MLKLALSGSKGRMGQQIIKYIDSHPEVELVAEFYENQDPKEKVDALEKPMDVWIEFSVPEAAVEYLLECQKLRVPMVIGTTGIDQIGQELIRNAAEHIPIVYSPNMSLGINLMFKLLEISTRCLEDHAHAGILDIHHVHKKDSPSGTALKLADVINQTAKKPLIERDQISSLRLGEMIGEHVVRFAMEGEYLEIKHISNSRYIYARGAVMAAQWLKGKPAGLYTMQQVLDI